MAEYGSMFAVSGLAAILFFGGWNGPVPITSILGMSNEAYPVWNYLANFLGMLNFVFKCCLWVTFMIWVRWTLPRLRIDQVMKTCLKYCTPIAAAMFAGAVAWTFVFPGGLPWQQSFGAKYITRDEAPSESPRAKEELSNEKTAHLPVDFTHGASNWRLAMGEGSE